MANSAFAQYAENKTWGEDGGDFESVGVGNYVGVLHKAVVKQAGQSGHWMLAIQIKLTEAESGNEKYIGRLHFLNLKFESKSGWNPWQVRAFFKSCNLELPEFENIEDVVNEMVGAGYALKFNVFEKDGYTNTKILECYDSYAVPEGSADAGDEQQGQEQEQEQEQEHAHEVDAEESEALPTVVDVDGWDIKTCKQFAADNDIVLGTAILAKAKDKIKEWILAQSSAEEAEEEESTDDALKEQLIAFCASNGIDDVDESLSIDELKEVIGQYEFESESLAPDEITLLESAGLEGSIKKPAPKKVVAKKK